MEELLETFLELPRLGQAGILIGILTPLLVLRSYLTPPKPRPAPNPPQKVSIQGDVRIQKK